MTTRAILAIGQIIARRNGYVNEISDVSPNRANFNKAEVAILIEVQYHPLSLSQRALS